MAEATIIKVSYRQRRGRPGYTWEARIVPPWADSVRPWVVSGSAWNDGKEWIAKTWQYESHARTRSAAVQNLLNHWVSDPVWYLAQPFKEEEE